MIDKQNLRKRNDDDDDFYCAKSRNDLSFLWDDEMNEMKGKTVHLKLNKSPNIFSKHNFWPIFSFANS